MRKRKSPIRHKVRQHIRQNRKVRSYLRGRGTRSIGYKKPVTFKIWEELTQPPHGIPWVRPTMGTRGHIEHEELNKATKTRLLTKQTLPDDVIVLDLDFTIPENLQPYIYTDQLVALITMNAYKHLPQNYTAARSNEGLLSQIKTPEGFVVRAIFRPYKTKPKINETELRTDFRQKYKGVIISASIEAKKKARETFERGKIYRMINREGKKIDTEIEKRLRESYEFESKPNIWKIKRKIKELDTSPIKRPLGTFVEMEPTGGVWLRLRDAKYYIYSPGAAQVENKQYKLEIAQAVKQMLKIK